MQKSNLLKMSFIATSLLISTVLASPLDQNKTVEDDEYYNYKKGWNLYFDTKKITPEESESELKKEPLSKKIELDLLQKILDENRKQTKIQEKILTLLEEELDPKPKEVVVNGKKCIANSSADCFVYPMIAEARRVPVMAEFLKDPYDLKKAGEYLRWQAGLFNHAINIGNGLQFAYAQWGTKVYPVETQSAAYTSIDGAFEAKILPEAEKELILSKKNILSFSIFVGKNPTMDIFSAKSILDVIKEYDQLDMEIIYFDQKGKEVFEGALASVYNLKMFPKWQSIKKEINPKKFEEYEVFTSPSFVAKLKNNTKNEAQTILNGKIDITSFRNRTISLLESKKMIDYNQLNESNAFKNSKAKEFVQDYYKKTENVDIKNLLK
ncbi:MAG: hypothetical protein EOM50_10430 [Erysipelotrichia bacterium]|nr:hypothetical protein [Erysipelotrichia bacterium]